MVAKYIKIFINYSFCTLINYIRGLFPKTFISVFTNPQCRKVLYVEKTWMGKQLSYSQYPLEEIDKERIKLEKENLPQIQKIISDYEGANKMITVDKIEKNHT